MKMSSVARSRQASIAAEPVSPEVAPMTRDPAGAARQHLVEQRPDELKSVILEGQGRPVEQFQEPQPGGELLQRRDPGVVRETGIGFGQNLVQTDRRDGVAQERRHDPGGDLGIGPSAQAPPFRGGQARPLIRKV